MEFDSPETYYAYLNFLAGTGQVFDKLISSKYNDAGQAFKEKKIFYPRSAATHGLTVTDNKSRPHEIAYRETGGFLVGAKDHLQTIGKTPETVVSDHRHIGADIAIGGYGNISDIDDSVIKSDGNHGHLYMFLFEGKAIMLGGESSGIGSTAEMHGQNHSVLGKSNRFSLTSGLKWTSKKLRASFKNLFQKEAPGGNDSMVVRITQEKLEYIMQQEFNNDLLKNPPQKGLQTNKPVFDLNKTVEGLLNQKIDTKFVEHKFPVGSVVHSGLVGKNLIGSPPAPKNKSRAFKEEAHYEKEKIAIIENQLLYSLENEYQLTGVEKLRVLKALGNKIIDNNFKQKNYGKCKMQMPFFNEWLGHGFDVDLKAVKLAYVEVMHEFLLDDSFNTTIKTKALQEAIEAEFVSYNRGFKYCSTETLDALEDLKAAFEELPEKSSIPTS